MSDVCELSFRCSPAVQAVYEEFFEQGDREKTIGHTPQAILDRSRAAELPKMQVCRVCLKWRSV